MHVDFLCQIYQTAEENGILSTLILKDFETFGKFLVITM